MFKYTNSVFMSVKLGLMDLANFLTLNSVLNDRSIALFGVGGCVFLSSEYSGMQQ